jgi:hypothetical protein
MNLRVVAIPLFAAICLASPTIAGGEQAQKGRGYRPRDGGGTSTAEKRGSDNRGGDNNGAAARERERTADNNTRTADTTRTAERRADTRSSDNGDSARTAERRDDNRPTSSGDNARTAAVETGSSADDEQRYARPRRGGSRGNARVDHRPIIVTRNRPNINIHVGSSYRGARYYTPMHIDYWARRYYRWSPIRYAPWSLIHGSIGFASYGFYSAFPSPYYYGPYAHGHGGPAPWNVGGYDIGGIRLKIRPRDALVFVDGYYAGLVDEFDGVFQSLRVGAGGHKIEIHMPGFEDLELDVHVQPGRTITLDEQLRPKP